MAARLRLLLTPQPSGLNSPLIAHRAIYRATIQNHPSIQEGIRSYSPSTPRYNYNQYGGNPYLPQPPPPKPARSTTFFRIVNSLSGLAIAYLLFCVVDELQIVSDAITQIEANHSRDQLDRQLERVRAEEMGPRDREYERLLVRWRSLAREEMMQREESLRTGE